MLDIVFFTSNRSKLAHFKYMGRHVGVRVIGFREKYFYASYHEPRIDDRETLLRESYQSALEQWRRRNKNDDTGIFILEDTSVRIDALSGMSDVPGVNVKYWMKGKTLGKINRLLGKHGGGRRASVRSDIILHIPQRFRDALGIGNELLWFFGETQGAIVEKEPAVRPNLLYPWLDNRTFNKWFVPDGYSTPISSLPIADADSADFRFRAFSKVIAFLSKIGLVGGDEQIFPQQLSIPAVPLCPEVILICGYSCVGKTMLAEWLRGLYGYMHLEASDFMYQEFWRRHGVTNSVGVGEFASSVLSQDPSVVPNAISAQISEKAYSKVVISGFRSPQEVVQLRKRLSPDREVVVVFLHSSEDVRYQRAVRRGRENISLDQMRRRDYVEAQMGLDVIGADDRVFHFQNCGSADELYSCVGERLAKFIHADKFHRDDYGADAARNLENLILLSLNAVDVEHKSYTTTEIATLVRNAFGVVRSKNNISRYFNQDFHPYFEALIEGKKIRYRLSNTGRSEALRLSALSRPRVMRSVPRKTVGASLDLFPAS